MSYTRVRRFQGDCEGDLWPEVWPEVLVFNPFVLDVLMGLKFITLDQTGKQSLRSQYSYNKTNTQPLGFIRDCGKHTHQIPTSIPV